MSESPTEPNGPAHRTVDLLPADEFGQYLLHSRSEILFILRALNDSKALITLHFDGGKGLLPTAILAADEDAVILDTSQDEELNSRVLGADHVVCSAMQDKIRIQFKLRGLRQATDDGRPAFAAPLPDELLRLQRREYYRLSTPLAQPIKCQIPISSGEHHYVEAVVVDISGGGLALMAPPEGVQFGPGMEFPNCRVDLPGVGTVVTSLRIRSVFDMRMRNGSISKRAGCQFDDLPGSMLTLIQRYIIRVERERKARETGFA
jgi:c-di-GMP-binding flagellar brake protein YcgR